MPEKSNMGQITAYSQGDSEPLTAELLGRDAKRRRLALHANEQRVAFAASIADVGRVSGYVRFREWEEGRGELREDEARRVGVVLGRMEEGRYG